ncbi:MAG: hypothetical protein ACUVS3_14380 [Thermodesulfobacteriota bacterium]
MAKGEAPFSELESIRGVRLACVFGPEGELLDFIPRGSDAEEKARALGAWAKDCCPSHPELKEVVGFYSRALVVWRKLEQKSSSAQGVAMGGGSSPMWADSQPRFLLVEAEAGASASFLRVSLEVMEHNWRSLGMDRVFPIVRQGKTEGGMFSKIFRRSRS